MSTSQHTTKSGEPDMRFKENQEGEPYQMDNLRGQGRGADQGGSNQSQGGSNQNQGGSNQGGSYSSNNQGESNLGGEHLTKEGKPDMRFKENQEGEPYQVEAGQKGGSTTQGQGGQGESGYQGGRGQSGSNEGQSEHLTKEGEPDMRFKENKEAYGQS